MTAFMEVFYLSYFINISKKNYNIASKTIEKFKIEKDEVIIAIIYYTV